MDINDENNDSFENNFVQRKSSQREDNDFKKGKSPV
jgi:hypothetical protein